MEVEDNQKTLSQRYQAFQQAVRWDPQRSIQELHGVVAYFLSPEALEEQPSDKYPIRALKAKFRSKVAVTDTDGNVYSVSMALLQKYFWSRLDPSTLNGFYEAYQAIIETDWEDQWWWMSLYQPNDGPSSLLDGFLENPNQDALPKRKVPPEMEDAIEAYRQALIETLQPSTHKDPSASPITCAICQEDLMDDQVYCRNLCCGPDANLCCEEDFQGLIQSVTTDVYQQLLGDMQWSGPLADPVHFIQCNICRSLNTLVHVQIEGKEETLTLTEALARIQKRKAASIVPHPPPKRKQIEPDEEEEEEVLVKRPKPLPPSSPPTPTSPAIQLTPGQFQQILSDI